MANVFAALHDLMIVLILIIAGLCLLLKVLQAAVRDQPNKSSTNKDLQNRLIRMTGGDRKTAARLFNHARYQYPGQSDTWYYERVIGDLERDRR